MAPVRLCRPCLGPADGDRHSFRALAPVEVAPDARPVGPALHLNIFTKELDIAPIFPYYWNYGIEYPDPGPGNEHDRGEPCRRGTRRAGPGDATLHLPASGRIRAAGSHAWCDRAATETRPRHAVVPPQGIGECRIDRRPPRGPLHLVPGRCRRDQRADRLPHRTLLPRHRRRPLRDGMRSGRVRPLLQAHKEQVMKRFHVHLGVPDLDASIRFYSGLFGMAPTVQKPDYAKWMLD